MKCLFPAPAAQRRRRPFPPAVPEPAASRVFAGCSDAVNGPACPIVDRAQRRVNRIASTISAATAQGGAKCLKKGPQRSEGKSKRPAPKGVRAAEDLRKAEAGGIRSRRQARPCRRPYQAYPCPCRAYPY